MQRLHDQAVLDLCYVPLDTWDATSYFKIPYNNCRLLHKHMKDTRCNESLSAHIISISENRLCQINDTNVYAIEDLSVIRMINFKAVVQQDHLMDLFCMPKMIS